MRTSTVQHASFFVLIALVTLSFLGLIHEFIQPLFWAAVLAILFTRLQRKFLRLVRGRSSLAAGMSVLVIVLIVILPSFLIAAAVTREALGLYERIAEGKSQFREAFQHEPAKGIILLVAGALIIGLVDNILRPILVGRDTRMPDFLILLSTLGGLTVFGISGFVLGPIIAALFLTIWDMFARDYTAEGNRLDPG